MAQINVTNLTYSYEGSFDNVFENMSFSIDMNWKLGFVGRNGCGKSTFLNVILSCCEKNIFLQTGTLEVGAGLVISYINQDTSFLHGNIKQFCMEKELEESLFCALLRQLDMERVQFAKQFEEFSEGQKKKVLIAESLMTPAHIYIWDEPLNYIDVFTRIQIEDLLRVYSPTMILVDHDIHFQEKIATRVVEM